MTTAHVAAHLNVRFPLETAEGHVASARLAVLREASTTMRQIGASEGGRSSPHSGPTRARRPISGTNGVAICRHGATGAAIKSSTLKAKSVERLANSHANSWAIGSAQGVSSWRAFREFGTPTDIAAPNIAPGALATAVAANITRLTCFPGCTTKLVAIRHYTGSCLEMKHK